MSQQCRETIVVTPPPRSELQYTTHCCCCEQSFWLKMPECIGITSTGTCLCCTGAGECHVKPFAEVDACNDSHGAGVCCSINQCKADGFTNATWCRGSGRSTSCFLFESKNEFDCRFPKTCCKCAAQECCCDYRCAFPCDEDVPMGISCCGKWLKPPEKEATGWTSTVKSAGDGGAAPATQNMS